MNFYAQVSVSALPALVQKCCNGRSPIRYKRSVRMGGIAGMTEPHTQSASTGKRVSYSMAAQPALCAPAAMCIPFLLSYARGYDGVIPIPVSILIHAATLQTAALDRDQNRTYTTVAALSRIRVEPSSKQIIGSDGTQKQLSGVMFFDVRKKQQARRNRFCGRAVRAIQRQRVPR